MKTVMITGANRGLGLELARAFHNVPDEDRVNLILHCRRGGKLPFWGDVADGDLRDPKTIDYLAKLAFEANLDILVNNAGIYLNKSILGMSYNEVRRVVEVNLLAPIFLTMAVWPVFARKKSGMVVNINSLAGKEGGSGESVYAATKAGLAGFSEALQFDATRDGVRVVNVNIGAMRTDMTKDRKDQDKFIDPADAAKMIVRLCERHQSMRVTTVDLKREIY